MLRIAVLDDYLDQALVLADWSAISACAEVVVFQRHLGDFDKAVKELADFDIICLVRERMAMPRALLERLPRLSFIAFTGTRNPSLDLVAASACGILVSHTNPSHGWPTLEIAWGLILSLIRHLPDAIVDMRQGGWQTTTGRGLNGLVLGLVGLGKLGSRMVPIARAFGMQVIAWSPNLTSKGAAEEGAQQVDKDTLFETADIVSVHMVLSERSRGLIGGADLARMKSSAILINTSRGPIVEEQALLAALEAGRIAGAGLDVYDVEPLPDNHPLRLLNNVALTPHLGYCVEESLGQRFGEMVANVAAYLDGRPIRLLNPELLTESSSGSTAAV